MISTKTPKALQNAAFFMVVKMFSLRGGVELRHLRPSQVRRHTNPDRYMYTKNVSKTCNGTIKHLHVPNKIVPLFRSPEAGERCPVYILDIYYSKLPKEAVANDVFFFRPLEEVPIDSASPWYSGSQSIGKNTLEHKLSRMCALAGIEGRITNHSLQATSATQMYEMGVPEKVIQERTGHRSIEALRVYERTNTHQQEAASNILPGLPVRSYVEQMHVARHHSQTTSLSLGTPPPSCTFQGLPISFGNLYGCTINIHNSSTNPQPTTPSLNITEAELDELVTDF